MAKQILLVLIWVGASLLPRPAHAQKPAANPSKSAKTPKTIQSIQTAPKSAAQPPNAKPQQAFTQANPYPVTPADSAIHFADSIFRQPTLQYQLVQPDIPTDIQSILVRFNNALVNDKEWFQQYRTAYAGKPLPYNQRFGITPDEYRKLQNIGQTPSQLVPVDTQKITVTREAGYIRFTTDGDIHLLDYLQIDLKKNFVVFGGDTIPLIGHTATATTSPYGEWEGYTWRLQKADAASTLATSRVTARIVEINMGLTSQESQGQPQQSAADSSQAHQSGPQQPLADNSQPAQGQPQQMPAHQPQQIPPQANRKTFLRLKYQDMRDGETKANLELVGYLLEK
jgi:hypothetical protein